MLWYQTGFVVAVVVVVVVVGVYNKFNLLGKQMLIESKSFMLEQQHDDVCVNNEQLQCHDCVARKLSASVAQ